jgi:hypothetical protein
MGLHRSRIRSEEAVDVIIRPVDWDIIPPEGAKLSDGSPATSSKAST